MTTSRKRSGAASSSQARAAAPAAPQGDLLSAPADAALLEAMLLGVEPIMPGAKRAAALQARIAGRLAKADAAPVKRKAGRGIVTVPAGGEGWVEALPKIHIKQVYTDGTAESYLVRLEPGARAPAHDHPGDEECVVLEGSVRYIGGSTLKAGDFEAVFAGARHGELVSDTGALVFLRYSQPLAGYLKL
ncbi:MAG TPA: cupin domain-containing protein [Burkholderiales bacterium]|nr:cupin domain-containing protein [Burkholderiales bacterium]